MLQTQAQQWDESKIKQFNKEAKEALLSDEHTLLSFSQDFGKLIQSQPSAVFIPKSSQSIQSLIQFAKQHHLPLTIRGDGLSQGGQSLSVPGGVSLSMQQFTKPLQMDGETIWVEANASWASLLEVTLQEEKAPFILPYNCNLSVAGVLSVGGVGAASFKYGTISAHIQALEVIDGLGVKQVVDASSGLFHACLSGQGQFAVITKAQIKLRRVKPMVRTFSLVYSDEQQWLADMEKLKDRVDYMELFCSPTLLGSQLKGEKRTPLVQWLYALHCTIEYEGKAPVFSEIGVDLMPWNIINLQEEPMSSYLLRHNIRFETMKSLGQWDLFHPWYECFVPTQFLKKNLIRLLADLPLHYASLVHIVPILTKKAGFLMYPEHESVCSFMILNPGVPEVLKDSCLQVIKDLDACFLEHGGKRYLSGFLGNNIPEHYWEKHFGEHFLSWQEMKKTYDPSGVFTSMLHSK